MRPKLSESQKRTNSITVNTGFRKMEGFDVVAKNSRLDPLGRTLPKTHPHSASGPSGSLKPGLKTAKSDSTKVVQLEQTIQTLEEQVRSLKALELQRSSLGQTIQLEDGVAINPHILALKTQYKSIKSTGELQIDALNDLIAQEARRQQDLEASLARYAAKSKDQGSDLATRRDFNARMLETLKVSLYEEKEFKIQKDRAIQDMQAALKVKTDENAGYIRRLEKEKITLPQKKEADANLVFNLKTQVANGLDTIKTLERELDELTNRIKTNPETKQIEQANLEYETRILVAEKDIANLRIREEELQMVLRANRAKRQQELTQKKDLIKMIEDLRRKVDENAKVNDITISERVTAKERGDVAEARRKLEDLGREREYVVDAIREEEHRTETLYNERLALQQEEVDEVEMTNRLRRTEAELREKLFKVRKEAEAADVRRAIEEEGLPALERETQELEARGPVVDREIEEALDRLEVFRQQRELSKQLKSLNLQDLKISKEANLEANENLNRFMRNYQAILDSNQRTLARV